MQPGKSLPQDRLVTDSGLQEALDVFADCFDARITIFDLEGQRLISGGKRPACRYCRAVRRSAKLLAACDASDRFLFHKARKTGVMAAHVCHAGMLEAVHPIMIYGRPCAFIMVGQIRIKGRRPASPYRKLQRFLKEKTAYSPQQARSILRLFEILTHHIMANHLLRFRTNEKFELLYNYLRDHHGHPLTVGELARHVGVSRTGLAKMFSRHAGQSFKQLLHGMRMEAAERLLKENPETSIKEVATAVGYNDALYFSRLYRKLRGKTPSSFKQHCQAKPVRLPHREQHF